MLDKPYYLCLIIMSGFASAALFSIWRYILLHAPVKGKKDLGLAYLSGAMGVWALVGCWGFAAPYFSYFTSKAVFSLLSTANSLLYLLAIQHFDYAPEQIRRRWWLPTVLVIGGLVMAATMALAWYSFKKMLGKDEMGELVNWPDVLFSFPTIIALSVGFWRSFYYRGYKLLAWLSLAAMTIVLLVQLPDVSHWLKVALGEVEHWLTASSYALMMMFCFALAASWGVEEFSLPQPNQTHLSFDGKEHRWWLLHVRVREQKFTAFMSPMALKNLLLFVVRRMENPQDGWVLIEDMNGGHVDFRRVILPLAEAWQEADPLSESVTLKEYVEKVRRALFEYRNPGQYRLKSSTGNWKFTDALLSQQNELADSMRSRTERDEILAMFQIINIWLKSQEKNRLQNGSDEGNQQQE
jgi:hypothetical protein